ncbi:MAG: DUF1080 domain-containing protein [Phycisphaerales bacterium]|nr:DUF1080 domain-containing protein [Phycisphaerales bacterium]
MLVALAAVLLWLAPQGEKIPPGDPKEPSVPQIAPGPASPAIEAGFKPLFDGVSLAGWVGDTAGYSVEDGAIVCGPKGGNLLTQEVYGDFELRLEFQLSPGANNGIGIRTPCDGDPAYVGMELQVLDDSAEQYRSVKPWQCHGSIYGVIPSKRGALKPAGEWNTQTVIAKGSRIQVVLNGTVIIDADVSEAAAGGTIDGRDHPGLRRHSGHIGFLGHGDKVAYRSVRIKEIR